MNLVCIGLSHHSAPLELREQLAFPAERLAAALAALDAGAWNPTGLREAVLLSTCNRSELYARVDAEAAGAPEAITRRLVEAAGADRAAVGPHLYTLTGPAAVRHLMRVSAGLDAMVLGEGEILGQVGQALAAAEEAGAVGPVLRDLFQLARRTARAARRETAIGTGAASIPSAAVRLAERLLGGLADRSAVVVGAGKMGVLTAGQLHRLGLRRLAVCNRSPERARRLAESWGAEALPMAGLPRALAEADLALSSTGSPGLVLTEPLLREAIALREPGRPLAIIDLALPRDVDPRARALPGIRLVDLDDLQAEVAGTLAERNQDIPQVEARIDAATAAFMRTLAQRRVAPTISKLHRWAEDLGRTELQRALRRMAALPESDRQTLEAMVTALVGKLIHPPIAELKGLGESEEAMARAVLMEQIFGLIDASPEARA